ncbi:unnamed protein product [Protopolystoma xenopodis]|uniref:Uncharacterized protein n=1 Tax=Protopolystoma xenopodis TaxID=117903 RepID=A0A448WXU9_9PLAT|nr:unnamed protein product [Protopolystoma xenopodis]
MYWRMYWLALKPAGQQASPACPQGWAVGACLSRPQLIQQQIVAHKCAISLLQGKASKCGRSNCPVDR